MSTHISMNLDIMGTAFVAIPLTFDSILWQPLCQRLAGLWQAGMCVPISMSMVSDSVMQVETASLDVQMVQQQCAAVESALKQAAATPPSRRMV